MKRVLALLVVTIATMMVASSIGLAEDIDYEKIRQDNAEIIQSILDQLPPGQETVVFDDMEFRVEDLWRIFVEQVGTKSTFTGTPWTDGKVYYAFATTGDEAVSATNQGRFRDACRVWGVVAQLEFIEITPPDPAHPVYVRVRNFDRNQSAVGMGTGVQNFSINDWESEIVIVHELGHTLGLHHEHQRSDRASYVDVLWGNIDETRCDDACAETNFGLLSGTTNMTRYDFMSVMHYFSTAFAESGKKTLVALDPYAEYTSRMGRADTLSYRDIAGMAMQYGHKLEIVYPTEGEPGYAHKTIHPWWWDEVDPILVGVKVYDADGNYETGLTAENFEAYLNGDEVDDIISVNEVNNVYTIELDPGVRDLGLYNLKVHHVGPGDNLFSVGVMEGGVVYVNQPLVERALAWLRDHQQPDGYWVGPSHSDRVAITSLALQGFLAAGYTYDDDPTVKKGIDYLLERAAANGNGGIYNSWSRSGYKCAMAITALRAAAKYNPSNLAEIETAIQNGQQFYLSRQTTRGWRYEPSPSSGWDMSVSQWPILALKGVDNPTCWSRVRAMLNDCRNSSNGGYGYQNSSATGTMTCAGIWGEVIAGGSQQHIDAAFGYLESYGDAAEDIVNAYDNHSWTYYYLYGLAKACGLTGKSRLGGGNWYEELSKKLKNSQIVNDENTKGYWNNTSSSYESSLFATDLAILALQVGTVPPNSRLIIRLAPDLPFVKGWAPPEDLMLGVTNSQGDYAGWYGGGWQTYPGAQWLSTGDVQELEVELDEAETFLIQVCNNSADPGSYQLEFEAYLEGGSDPVDADLLEGILEGGQCGSGQATVNGIEVISIFAPDTLECMAEMAVAPDSVDFPRIRNEHQYSFQIEIDEVSECGADLTGIDVFLPEDPEDMYGNLLPTSFFTITPDTLDVPAGSSATIDVILSIPEETAFDMQECTTFVGRVLVESFQGTQAVHFTATPVHDAPVQGTVAANGEGLLGVPVYVIDTLGDTADVAVTDVDGYYLTEDLPIADYTVTTRVPLGYDLLSDLVVPITIEGDTVTVNFDLEENPSSPGCGSMSNWFWAWQAWGAIQNYQGLCYDRDCVIEFRERVHAHFDPHFNYFVDVTSLHDMFMTLFTFWQHTCRQQAESQFYALLLNVAANRLNTYEVTTEDGATVAQAIAYCDQLLSENNPDSDRLVLGLARAINWDWLILPAGYIPLDMPQIAYKPGGDEVIPDQFYLAQNYPNPFNPVTDIQFGLPTSQHVRLTVFNIIGQTVEVLADENMPAGYHTIQWDASGTATGVYFYRLEAGDFVETKKMLMMK